MFKLKWKLSRQFWIRLKISFIFVLFAGNATAAPAILVVDAQLKSQPSFKSKDKQSLATGVAVEIIMRERGWYQVETQDKQTGWLTLLQVRLDAIEQAATQSGNSRMVSLRSGHSQITATTGVRGIGEADIANAKADFAALEAAKAFKVSEKNVKTFAATAPLKSTKIEYQEQINEK